MFARAVGLLWSINVLRGVAALDSELCLARLQQGLSTPAPCHSPMCGQLHVDETRAPFLDRLSPSCRRVMEAYASEPPTQRFLRTSDPLQQQSTSVAFGLRTLHTAEQSNTDTDFVKCSTTHAASFASNPVVVERPDTANFVVCTVPKAGCSLFRSLLFALTHPSEDTASFHGSVVHQVPYPTIWHYSETSNLPDSYPSFVIGRNPYIRLLSGFLDKMVVSNGSHDWPIMERVNRDLGLAAAHAFLGTAEGFSEFVRLLARAARRNQHFDTATNVCGIHRYAYRYLLRLEDMHDWYPCWVQGLGLSHLTDSGWAALPGGVIAHSPSEAGCWWKPVGASCGEYYAQTHDTYGDALPGGDWHRVPDAGERDAHDTGAANRWQQYYTAETADLVYDLFADDFEAFGYERLDVAGTK